METRTAIAGASALVMLVAGSTGALLITAKAAEPAAAPAVVTEYVEITPADAVLDLTSQTVPAETYPEEEYEHDGYEEYEEHDEYDEHEEHDEYEEHEEAEDDDG